MDYCTPLRTVIPVGSETSEFSRNTNGWWLVGESTLSYASSLQDFCKGMGRFTKVAPFV